MALPSSPAPESTQAAIDQLRLYFPGWPDEVLRIVADRWIDHGDILRAIAETRAADEYANAFPGLVREDGSLRFGSEQDYLMGRELFRAELESIGINPNFFDDAFVSLLEDEVSVPEMIDRIESIYANVIDRSPELRAFYALPEHGGLTGLTDEAIVASALDPSIGTEILNRRIGIASIGAEATTRGLGVDFDLIERLYEVGTTLSEASDAFGAATEVVPIINVLASRHNDPDDDFDIEEFTAAQLLDDPFQRRRMRQLLARERASFTSRAAFSIAPSGAVRGLASR